MVTVIQIIAGALGTVPKGLERELEDLEICGSNVSNPDYHIGQNTEMSTGDMRRLAVTQMSVKYHRLTLV